VKSASEIRKGGFACISWERIGTLHEIVKGTIRIPAGTEKEANLHYA